MSLCHPRQPPSLLWLLFLQSQNLPKSHPGDTPAVLYKGQFLLPYGKAHPAEGLGEVMSPPPKPFGIHGKCFFPCCASTQGPNQRSEIADRVPGSTRCRTPTCYPSSHVVTAGWHCSHSSRTSLQMQVPDMACCHQRAPPAAFASVHATTSCASTAELCSKSHWQERKSPKGSKFQSSSTDMVGSWA